MAWWNFINPFKPVARPVKPIPTVVVDHPTQGPTVVPVATRKSNRFAAGTAGAALLVSTVGGFEGLRQTAYPDPATRGDPWTICYGHTGKDVTPGVKYSLEQCKTLLIQDTAYAWTKIQQCTKGTDQWGDSRAVAVLSLAYNIGAGAYCKSSVARAFNEGRAEDACDNLLKFNRAAGMVMTGLTRRREKERTMCLENI